MLHRVLVAVTALTVVAAACGDAASADGPSGSAPPLTATGPALQASCGGLVLPGGSQPVLPDAPLDGDAEAAIAGVADAMPGEEQFFGEYDWSLAERAADRLVLFGRSLRSPSDRAPPYGTAAFVRSGDTWTPEGWGQCRIDVSAEGFGNAPWVVDPDVTPDPAAATLAVLINERECAGGRPPEGRDVIPVVVPAADRVTITVLVERIEGDATCPSNPWHPVVVDLPEPIRDRPLFDGSRVPPLERPLHPSQSSLDSLGAEQ